MLLVDPNMNVLNMRILHQAILVIRVYCTYVPSSDPPPCTLYNVAVPGLSCVWAPQEYSRLKYSSMRFLASKHWFDRTQEHRNFISCREEVDDALFNKNAIKSPRKPF